MRALLFLLILAPLSAFAQGDLSQERASLKGVTAFAVDMTVEGPRHLVESDLLRSEVLLHHVLHQIRESALQVERVKPGAADPLPRLHVHVNMIQLDRGLVPFSISAEFYQEVRLTDGRDVLPAITWRESVLGLVSQDLLSSIPGSVEELVGQFVDDFLDANKR